MSSTDPGLKPKRTVQKLTNGDRKWICKRRMSHKEEKFVEMQHAFRSERNPAIELKSGTVSGILKQSDKWLSIADGQESGTRTRSSKEPELEAALFAWRNEQLAKDEKVRDEDLRDKARELAAAMGINTDRGSKGLSFSSGWLDRFKKRNSIKQTRYNRHGKKDSDKQPELQHSSAFPQLSPQTGTPDLSAVVGAHNVPSVAHGAALHYLHPHLQQVMPGALSVNGIPSVPHVASVAQPASVPLPQQDTFSLPQPDAAIPQPPSATPENDDSAMLHNSNPFQGANVYSHLLQQPPVVGPPDAGPAEPPLPSPSVVNPNGIAVGSQAVPQPVFVDVPLPVPSAMSVARPTHFATAHQDAAMGIPAPEPPFQHQAVLPPVTGGVLMQENPALQILQEAPQIKAEDEDIANIPPPADIPDEAQGH